MPEQTPLQTLFDTLPQPEHLLQCFNVLIVLVQRVLEFVVGPINLLGPEALMRAPIRTRGNRYQSAAKRGW